MLFVFWTIAGSSSHYIRQGDRCQKARVIMRAVAAVRRRARAFHFCSPPRCLMPSRGMRVASRLHENTETLPLIYFAVFQRSGGITTMRRRCEPGAKHIIMHLRRSWKRQRFVATSSLARIAISWAARCRPAVNQDRAFPPYLLFANSQLNQLQMRGRTRPAV